MDMSFPVAIKVMKNFQVQEDEVKIMKKLNHENVIALHGVCTSAPAWIITEFMPGGSLFKYLQNNTVDIIMKLDFALQVSNNHKIL